MPIKRLDLFLPRNTVMKILICKGEKSRLVCLGPFNRAQAAHRLPQTESHSEFAFSDTSCW